MDLLRSWLRAVLTSRDTTSRRGDSRDFNDPNDDVVTNDQSLIHTAAYDDHGIASMPSRKELEYSTEAATLCLSLWPSGEGDGSGDRCCSPTACRLQ
jgi:hypothetical protein